MSLPVSLSRLFFLLCLLLPLSGSYGAEQPKPPVASGAPAPATSAPAPIENSEIIPRAEQALRSLREIRSQIAGDTTLSSVDKEFALFAETSDRRHQSAAEAISKSRSVQRINEILREWNIEQQQLEGWEQALTRKSESLTALEKKVDQIVATWSATQAAVAKKIFFKAVLERRVEEVLKEAQATHAVIQQQTTRLLRLQGEVADRLENLAKLRKEIDEARQDFGRGLLSLDRLLLLATALLAICGMISFLRASASVAECGQQFHLGAHSRVRAPAPGGRFSGGREHLRRSAQDRFSRQRDSHARGRRCRDPQRRAGGGRFTNWSLFDRMRRISISVGVAYGTEPKRVIEILKATARKHPAVFTHPAPCAVFDRFADSALNFTLLCWSSVDAFFPTKSELTVAIEKEFKKLGIQVPFPQQDVHLHWPGDQPST